MTVNISHTSIAREMYARSNGIKTLAYPYTHNTNSNSLSLKLSPNSHQLPQQGHLHDFRRARIRMHVFSLLKQLFFILLCIFPYKFVIDLVRLISIFEAYARMEGWPLTFRSCCCNFGGCKHSHRYRRGKKPPSVCASLQHMQYCRAVGNLIPEHCH